MQLYLEIEAMEAPRTSIEATGRNVEQTGSLERNLMLTTYREILRAESVAAPELALKISNGIPLGMGCGSSAAALLAGTHLANHFGKLGWSEHRILTEACLREGHPDNVAACALGGLTVSTQDRGEILTATIRNVAEWQLMLALPESSLATEKARALLPEGYSRGDAVANVQRSSLLVAAFALGRGDLLRVAMQDRLHQPYRGEACPLLPRLLPLADGKDVLGVALSGAGPSVLLITSFCADRAEIKTRVLEAAGDIPLQLIETGVADNAEVTIFEKYQVT